MRSVKIKRHIFEVDLLYVNYQSKAACRCIATRARSKSQGPLWPNSAHSPHNLLRYPQRIMPLEGVVMVCADGHERSMAVGAGAGSEVLHSPGRSPPVAAYPAARSSRSPRSCAFPAPQYTPQTVR